MSDLVALKVALAAVDPGEGVRCDGWTGPRRRTFLEHLCAGLSVEKACGLVGLSVASAYALRQRAGAEAFALGWRAARLIGRDHLAETLLSRAVEGQTDTWMRADGQEVTRHRHDNRLALGLLTRLDRLAEGWEPRAGVRPGGAPVAEAAGLAPAPAAAAVSAGGAPVPSPDDPLVAARLIAMEMPAFLDLVEQERDAAAVDAFVRAAIDRRYPQPPQLAAPPAPATASPADTPWWFEPEEEEWRTTAPPPPRFNGYEALDYGEPGYWRTLTRAETSAAEIEAETWLAVQAARAGEDADI